MIEKQNKSLPGILFAIWLFIVLPVVQLKSTMDPGLAIRFFLTALPLTLIFISGLFQSELSIRYSRSFLQFSLILLLSMGWMAVSCFQSINPGDALWEFFRMSTFYLFFLTCFLLFQKNENVIRILGRFSLVAVIIFTVYGLYQLIPIWMEYRAKGLPMQIDLRISSTLGNKNFFSEVMVMLIPLQAYNFFRDRRNWKIAYGFGLICTMTWIVLLQSLASWVALLLAAIIIPVFTDIFKKNIVAVDRVVRKKKRVRLTAILFLAVVFIVFIFSRSNNLSLLRNKASVALQYIKEPALLDSTSNINNNSVFERLLIWRNSLRMIHDHPLTGAGLNNWKLLQPQYGIGGTDFLNTGLVHFEHPHNDYLLLLSEQGPLGLLLYILIFVFLLQKVRQSIRLSEEPETRELMAWLGFGIVAFSVMSFFAYPRSRFYVMLVLMVYAALVIVYNQEKNKKSQVPARLRILIGSMCALIALGGTAAAWFRLRGEVHTRELLSSQFSKNYPRMIRDADKAESVFYKMDLTGTPLAWYRGMAYFYSGNFAEAIRQYEIAEGINPYHLRVLNDLATSYEKNGQQEKAIEKYRLGLKIAPLFTEGLLNLSATYFNTGQLDSSFAVISRIQQMKMSLREEENYKQFLKAILGEKAKRYFLSRFEKFEAENCIKWLEDQQNQLEIFKLAKSQNVSFEEELERNLSLTQPSDQNRHLPKR